MYILVVELGPPCFINLSLHSEQWIFFLSLTNIFFMYILFVHLGSLYFINLWSHLLQGIVFHSLFDLNLLHVHPGCGAWTTMFYKLKFTFITINIFLYMTYIFFMYILFVHLESLYFLNLWSHLLQECDVEYFSFIWPIFLHVTYYMGILCHYTS